MPSQVINGVKNFYGTRSRFEAISGSMGTKGSTRELTVMFDADNRNSVSFTLPAGTVVTGNAICEVSQAFALGGTTPTINLGVSGSADTNRLAQLSQAQAQAVGTYSVAPAGTLALNTPLTAPVTIVVALGGGTPTMTAGTGQVKISIPIRDI